ncbi:ABC transporter substrate-binding protein [Acetobacter sacchari]|uniref:ABC transporter substrate-binding protein n=1 Tax=Acetobacter sacchari TaxID=2661687 RepID=A0ABS3LWL0_9PROT|nr:ABC transporter substrate-binding protein [Acetobacter sacchari]MBO1360291.1 ABC transporter substrate-binding protein [Acetobacter sacchari]
MLPITRLLCALGITAAAVAFSQPALATGINSGVSQFAPAVTPGAMPTRFVKQDLSLEQLLNAGYEIRSSASSEGGAALILFRPAQPGKPLSWIRCELLGDGNGAVMLHASHAVTSDCRGLN